jgi:imidazolonepropionase-like amidohydrolase
VLTPAEVIRSATTVNARILKREGEIGVVAPGARADLLVVEGDPLSDVRLLAEPEKNLSLILRGGRIVVDRVG